MVTERLLYLALLADWVLVSLWGGAERATTNDPLFCAQGLGSIFCFPPWENQPFVKLVVGRRGVCFSRMCVARQYW